MYNHKYKLIERNTYEQTTKEDGNIRVYKSSS